MDASGLHPTKIVVVALGGEADFLSFTDIFFIMEDSIGVWHPFFLAFVGWGERCLRPLFI